MTIIINNSDLKKNSTFELGINIKHMAIINITKEFRFEGAHTLCGYDGKCRHIHGHSYRLFVTVKGSPITDSKSPKYGMLIDFTDLKDIVNRAILDKFDHALIIKEGSPLINEIQKGYDNVVVVPFQPTCENLVIYFAEIIGNLLNKEVSLHSIKLYETATSFAEWKSSDN